MHLFVGLFQNYGHSNLRVVEVKYVGTSSCKDTELGEYGAYLKMRSIHELLSVGIQDTKLYFCYKVVLHATLSGMKEKPDVLSLSKKPLPSVLTSAKTMLIFNASIAQ